MLPVLLDLPYIKIYTQGVFLLLAFFWAAFMLWRLIRLTSYKEEIVFDGFFIGLFGALFGGRLVYVIFNWGNFGFDIFKFLLINGYPGISVFGMLAGGAAALALFYSSRKYKVIELFDYYTTSIFLALGFAKIGAFFSGSEIGAKTTFPLSLRYPNIEGMHHLTPFYESILFFAAAAVSYKLIFEVRKEKYQKGFLTMVSLWYISLVYALFDNLKVNTVYYQRFSVHGITAGVLLLTLSLYIVYYFRGFLLDRYTAFINLLFHHEQKTNKRVHSTAKKEA